MSVKSSISVEIDTEAGAAYVRLSSQPVHRTEQFTEDINVDLDAVRMVVGIELLDLTVTIPLDDLAARYHVDSSTLELLLASITMQASAGVTATSATASTSAGYGAVQATQMHRERRAHSRETAGLS